MMVKRGQMKLSFGMIFSIILIIVFIIVAFYAIMKFVGLQKNVSVAQFKDDLEKDIDKLWRGSQGSQPVEYRLPSEIQDVCFVDYSEDSEARGDMNLYSRLRRAYTGYENLFFYPLGFAEGLDSTEINHIDLGRITAEENPFCLPNTNGKIKMTLSKDYGEALVMVSE